MKYIIESEKKIEVRADHDVVVAGGGFAGVAAAVSAARMGANVLLIEREYMLGGLGTLGLITIYEPIDDGLGHQVAFSMAEELLRLSIKHGWEGDYCDAWLEDKPYEAKRDQRFRVRFNANVCAILMEQLLLESGVKLLYGTTVSAVHMEGDKIKALIVENKAGRYAVGCKTVVDVTGDADIVKYAGGKTARFGPGNILACWHYEFVDNEFLIRKKGAAEIQGKKPAEGEANKVKRYSGIEDLTDIAIDAHESILEYFLKNGNVTPRHALTAVATIPQVRMTRRICGEYTMDIREVHKRFEDSIGMCGNWRKTEDVRGEIYEIPFRTMYNAEIKNLITAGRSISVTDTLWDITRVIPVCVVTGEAAGVAAVMTDDFSTLDVAELQKILVSRGVVLHEADLNI